MASIQRALTFFLFEMLLPLTRFRLIDLDRLLPGCRDSAGSNIMENTDMANGTVKWFNATKGFGFIQPEHGSKDIFLHISAVERAGISRIDDGQKVTFDVETGRDGRESATNLALA
ncbi:cold shock CspA family protein [Rhodovulum visakhapatnamense]|uniref:Cold shock CspA family protein n=4 Tax=Rhodovulum TaxID=34008 RepID=A0A4R8GAI4_9RHOB|nr:cold shock CspA family protein [Rhodovulum visakhapatnamense]